MHPPAHDALRARAFDTAPWAALVVGHGGEVAAMNEAARVMFGADLARRGRPLGELEGCAAVGALAARAAESGASVREAPLEIAPAPGFAHEVEAIATPLGDDGVLLTLRPPEDEADDPRAGGLNAAAGLGRTLAHEIKNPLAGIRGAAQLIQAEGEGQGAELAGLIVEEADRIVRLVDRVEALSDARPPAHRPVNIHAALDRVRRLAQSGSAPRVRFRERYDPSLPEVEGDEDQIVQVLLNLVKNGAEAAAGPGGDREGEVVLATAYRHGGHVRRGIGWRSTPIEIRIEDDGAGVDPAVRERLFDAFVTTKPRGEGLGLALAAKLVADHGGSLDHRRENGRTVFRILLPKASQ